MTEGYREILCRWLRAFRLDGYAGPFLIAERIEAGEPERWWAEQQGREQVPADISHGCEYKRTPTGRKFVCTCGAYSKEAP